MPVPVPSASPSADTLRQQYVANLAALYRVDPDLAHALEAIPFAALDELEPTRDGGLTVRRPDETGARVYVHSRYEPRREARELAAAHVATEPRAYVLSGGGLGYTAEALEAACNQPIVIVLENDLALLKACCALHDLAARLVERRLVFLWQADRAAVYQSLNPINAAITLGVVLIAHPYTTRCNAAFHTQMRRLISDYASFMKTQIVTLLKTARTTFRNVAFNLGHYLAQPGVQSLAGRAAGRPAFVVAAGPSLARHLDDLRAVQDRAVIICVQTIFKLLRQLGIRPHFVTSLDFHEISAEFFRGQADVGGCRLVAEPKAAHVVLDGYPAERYVLHHRFIDTLLADAGVSPRGSIPAGSTVAHLAYYLAEHLGCDPILFVGQDLAFSDGLFYLPGSPIEDIWRPELGRFQTIEMKQWERVVRNRGILRRVRDVHDRPIYTDDLLFSYAEQFAKDIAGSRARVVQIGEHGVRLPGASASSFADAAREFCAAPLPADWRPAWETPAVDWARAAAALSARFAEATRVRAIAVEMATLLRRLEELVERPAEFNRQVARVDELRLQMGRCDAMFQLVVEVSARANLRRYGADKALGRVERETAEVARTRLQRDREFVEGFIEGCDFVLEVLPEAEARLARRAAEERR